MSAAWCALYLIADTGLVPRTRLLDVVEAAIADGAGVTAVQLRDKTGTARESFDLGIRLRAVTARHEVHFLLNDRVDLALAVDADGVHLGPDDLPLALARDMVPPGFLLGYSAGTPSEAREAEAAGASYLGVGAAYATATKSDAGAPIGPAGVAAVRAVTGLPVVAIGGITLERVAPLLATGVHGVAVAGAVLCTDDPAAAARALRRAVAEAPSIR